MLRDVFVSHASDDHPIATQVCDLLEQRGITCWIAPRNVSAGAVWDEAILDAIEQARVFLLILSTRANDSAFVKNEVNRAFAEGKPILTLRIEDVAPGRSMQLYLARHHWMDAFPPPIEPRVEQLAASIGKLLQTPAEAPPPPAAEARAESRATEKSAKLPRPKPAPGPRVFGRPTLVFSVLAASILAALVGGGVASKLRPAPPPPPVARFTYPLPNGQQFGFVTRRVVDLSPDGTQLVYSTIRQLHLKSMAQLEAKPIWGSEKHDKRLSTPVFSPDGLSVAFFEFGNGPALTDRTLKRIPTSGGAAVTLCPVTSPSDLSWSPDGILFTDTATLWRISPNGGKPEALLKERPDELMRFPQLLPGGRGVLLTLVTRTAGNRADKAQTIVHDLKSGERKVVLAGGADTRYLPTGHLVYAHEGVLFALPFDLGRLATTGGPAPVVEGVLRGTGALASAHFSTSATGILAYVPGPVATGNAALTLAHFDRKGTADVLKIPAGQYELPRLSPDGQRIAFGNDEGAIWIYDVSGTSAARRLTLGGQGQNRFPIWSADGQSVTFQSDREKSVGIFRQRADGSSAAERLVTSDEGTTQLIPEAWSPDGTQLLFSAVRKDATTALMAFSVATGKTAPVGAVTSTSGYVSGATFSPDGRWVAYASNEGRGASAIFVQPFPPTGAKYQISKDNEAGHHPVWSPDGKELFYTPGPGNSLHVVRITTEPAFGFGEVVALNLPGAFRFNQAPIYERPYDLSRDGQRFLGVYDASRVQRGSSGDSEDSERIEVVLNWFEELKRKVPVK